MRKRAAFTLVELLVVIAIIAVLASLLLPSLKRAQDQAKTARCASNLKQIGLAMLMYSGDHNEAILGAFPWTTAPPAPDVYARTWLGFLYHQGYCPSKDVMKCPGDPVRSRGLAHWDYTFDNSSYGHNLYTFGRFWADCCTTPIRPVRLNQVKNPAQTYLAGDNSDNPNDPGSYLYAGGPTRRHNDGINMLWVDGHVSWLTREEQMRHHSGGGSEPWYDADLPTLGY